MYQIKLEQFAGPLDLLLQLVEKDKLNINQISLVQLTDQFLAYLRQDQVPPEEVADFLVVAAKLLLIKSQSLFPQMRIEDEDDLSLQSQLKIYKEFWEASKGVNRLMQNKQYIFFRERMAIEPAFRPPPTLTAQRLESIYQEIIKNLEPIARVPSKVAMQKVSLDERIATLKNLVLEKMSLSFDSIVKSKNKAEKVVHFLALLELIKRQIVQIKQNNLFGDIIVEKF